MSITPVPVATPRYTLVARILHWLMALALTALVTVGYTMKTLPLSPLKLQVYSWHKWAGISLLVLVILRLLVEEGGQVTASVDFEDALDGGAVLAGADVVVHGSRPGATGGCFGFRAASATAGSLTVSPMTASGVGPARLIHQTPVSGTVRAAAVRPTAFSRPTRAASTCVGPGRSRPKRSTRCRLTK